MKKAVFPAALALLSLPATCHALGRLQPRNAIDLPGPAAKFDFMVSDAGADRILAAHRGAGTLEILDLATGKPLSAVPVGAAQGVAVDAGGGRYFAGNEAEKSVVAVDTKSLQKTGEAKVEGPVDAVAYDSKRDRVYAAEDDGSRLWVIDAKTMKLAGEVKIPGEPEMMAYDPATDHLYLNIKNKDEVVRINPDTNQVDATWATAPAKSPHGLAIDSKLGRLFSAGGNGRLVELDLATGKLLGQTEIAPKVDQIAYDPEEKRIYSAGKEFLSVTEAKADGLRELPGIKTPKGAHTIAVDPKRHDVWISYADAKSSHLRKFTPAK